MNLVEHPFALLKRAEGLKAIEQEWEQVHPRTGKIIKSSWRVTSDPELGMPGPVEERLYMVLMELTREQGWPREVFFTQRELLARLGRSDGKANYTMLRDAFRRLRGVVIDTENSFWDAEAQEFRSINFSLLDEVDRIPERPGRKEQLALGLSSFIWSKVMHRSFEAGNVRSFDIDFALSLTLPLSTRLYRYLDKHRTTGEAGVRHKFEIELHRLCEIHLGMTKARYASKLKERLLPAHQELQARGFLADVTYEPMKTQPGAEKAVYYFTNAALSPALAKNQSENLVLIEPATTGAPPAALPYPNRLELLVALDRDDEALRDPACDAVFEVLSDAEKAKILKTAKGEMPEILRANMSSQGARNTLARKRRELVWNQFREAVEAILQQKATAEIEFQEKL